ncbi:MAG: hypothetical protein EOM12_03835 [Verrucomicrobiae bacterium]|nr:hypothetical protein [Verrucomicrobiae bacterium]
MIRDERYKDPDYPRKYRESHREHAVVAVKLWRKKNPEKVLLQKKRHSQRISEKRRLVREEKIKNGLFGVSRLPWYRTWYWIKSRCENKRAKNYLYYGGRGIKCLITVDQIKYLWVRDRAALMKKPSIDRINNDRHYEKNNCRFIEQSENTQKKFFVKNRKGVK